MGHPHNSNANIEGTLKYCHPYDHIVLPIYAYFETIF